jgi:CheY-like chemotaxis protein
LIDTNIVIVLVEDNEDDQALATRALERAGVTNQVVVLEDGVKALSFFEEAGRPGSADSERTYLVLLDLKLPRMGGLQVLRRLREDPRTRRIPVVVLTSSDEERDLVESYDLGANSYIRKPVDFAQFSEVIRQLGYYWLALNRPPPGGLHETPESASDALMTAR